MFKFVCTICQILIKGAVKLPLFYYSPPLHTFKPFSFSLFLSSFFLYIFLSLLLSFSLFLFGKNNIKIIISNFCPNKCYARKQKVVLYSRKNYYIYYSTILQEIPFLFLFSLYTYITSKNLPHFLY